MSAVHAWCRASETHDHYRKFNARPFLDPTPSNTQMEEKRRTWWSLVMFDRYVSLGAWKPSVPEADLMAVELPICTVDFECEVRHIYRR